MKMHLLIGSAIGLALGAPAAASFGNGDPDRLEELREKQQERAEERREAAEEAREKMFERRAEQSEKRAEQRREAIERRRERQEERAEERRADIERYRDRQEDRADRYRDRREKVFEHRAERVEKLAERREKAREKTFERIEHWDDDDDDRLRSFGRAWSPSYVPTRYRAMYRDNRDYYYRYAPEGLYRVRRDNDVVAALIPLLGGAFSVGQTLPAGYGAYNVPLQYRNAYYDTPDRHYRYGDRAIYSVDPTTNLIQGVAALLTGNQLGIGSTLPTGFDAYNLPLDYRDRYSDTADNWYRYNDGYIYQVDPTTRLITAVIEALV